MAREELLTVMKGELDGIHKFCSVGNQSNNSQSSKGFRNSCVAMECYQNSLLVRQSKCSPTASKVGCSVSTNSSAMRANKIVITQSTMMHCQIFHFAPFGPCNKRINSTLMNEHRSQKKYHAGRQQQSRHSPDHR